MSHTKALPPVLSVQNIQGGYVATLFLNLKSCKLFGDIVRNTSLAKKSRKGKKFHPAENSDTYLIELVDAIHKDIIVMEFSLLNTEEGFSNIPKSNLLFHVSELKRLADQIHSVQSMEGCFYYHNTGSIHERSFFRKNLLTNFEIENNFKQYVDLIKKTRLAVCDDLVKLAYFKLLELHKIRDYKFEVDIVMTQYWSHSLLRIQSEHGTFFYDPWASLQIKRFGKIPLLISAENLGEHIKKVVTTVNSSKENVNRINPTRYFFDISSRTHVRNYFFDYESVQVCYGKKFQNDPGILSYIREPRFPFSLFGKTQHQIDKRSKCAAVLGLCLLSVYELLIQRNDIISTLPWLIMTTAIIMSVCIKAGKFNLANKVYDEDQIFSLVIG